MSPTQSNNTWYYITLVKTAGGDNGNFYINGILQTTYTGTISDPNNIGGTYLMNYGNANAGFNGSLDEFRVSNIARSADWIKTEYNNQCSPSTFYAYGALGANGRQSSSGAAVPAVRVRGGVKFH